MVIVTLTACSIVHLYLFAEGPEANSASDMQAGQAERIPHVRFVNFPWMRGEIH